MSGGWKGAVEDVSWLGRRVGPEIERGYDAEDSQND